MTQAVNRTTGGQWTPEIRIANPPPALLAKYTVREKKFFYDYASFVVKTLGNDQVQGGLARIFAIENLRFEKLLDIRVMVFPARQLRGRSDRVLHGSYSHSSSQISLYPLKFPRDWVKREGFDLFTKSYDDISSREKRLLYEMSKTAIATLLHEILHVKFEGRGMASYAEEGLVRKLEGQYMQDWEPTISLATKIVFADSSLRLPSL